MTRRGGPAPLVTVTLEQTIPARTLVDYNSLTVRERARLGEAIRAGRVDIGISQTQLGKAVGLSPCTISRIERGLHETGPETRWELADALGWFDNVREAPRTWSVR